ncbi:MAG: hypothetical protein ACRD20_02420 [Terriglobales bacterium]
MIRPATVSQSLRCPLTDQEKIRFGEGLARLLEEYGEVEDEKTAVNAKFKAQLEGIEAASTKARKVLSAGYEYRWIDCRVLYNDPASRQKTLVRLDTGEVVRIEDMSEEECQENLFSPPAPGPVADVVQNVQPAEPAKEALLPLPLQVEPNGPEGPGLQSALPGNDEQLPAGVSRRIPGGDQQERSAEAPIVEHPISTSAKESAEALNGKRKRKPKHDPQSEGEGVYPA